MPEQPMYLVRLKQVFLIKKQPTAAISKISCSGLISQANKIFTKFYALKRRHGHTPRLLKVIKYLQLKSPHFRWGRSSRHEICKKISRAGLLAHGKSFYDVAVGLIIIIFFSITTLSPYSGQIGSDSAVAAAQARIVFDGDDTSNNRIARYALMSRGFSLEDSETTCSFDSVFPVSTFIGLQRGTLRLTHDLKFVQDFSFGTGGSIEGDGKSIEFPTSLEDLFLPISQKALSYITNDALAPFYSVSWSHDDTYIASAAVLSGNRGYLVIHEFTGSTLVSLTSLSLGVGLANSVDFHPTSYDICIGRDAPVGHELRVYTYTPPTTLTLVDSVNRSGDVMAVAWHPSGDYVATACADNTVSVYSYNGVALSLVDSIAQTPVTSSDALRWDATGGYLVSGTEGGGTDNLFIYNFNGSVLAARDSTKIESGAVTAVDWMQTYSYIAVGTDSGTHRLKVYFYNEDTDALDERLVAQDVYNQTPRGLSWGCQGDSLAVISDQGEDSLLRTYCFNHEREMMRIASDTGKIVNDGLSVSWSHYDSYLVAGDSGPDITDSYLSVFACASASPVRFSNTTLVCNSPVVIRDTILFQDSCSFRGNKYGITFDAQGSLAVAPGATLTLENVSLDNLQANKLVCQANNSSIVLKNSKLKLSENYTFSVGSIRFEQDVKISGTTIFAYETSQASTIASDAKLTFAHDTTFSYAPPVASRDLLSMTDQTSRLHLKGCTLHSTATGIRLTKGTLLLDDLVTFSCEGLEDSEAICWGGETADDDLFVTWGAGANLDVYGGFAYK